MLKSMNRRTKQIFITNLNYPIESLFKILFESEVIKNYFENSEFKIKLFIGSGWSIQNSGFCVYGPNGLYIVFELKYILQNDFGRQNLYSVLQINTNKINKDVEVEFSLIKNTCDNTSIIDIRMNFDSEEEIINFENYIKLSYIKEIVNRIMTNVKIIFNQIVNKEENIPKIVLNHSFIIKKNYKEAFNFFYNWNDNLAKTLKTDKVWKIMNEKNKENDSNQYKNFSILINDDIKVYYKIKSIVEDKGKKIEIIYDKSGKNFVPALNNYIKFTFFNVDKNLCLFLYETHLPYNINSSIYQTVSNYLFYCNYQSRKYIEHL